MLKKDSIQPLYRQLMEIIISQIQNGNFRYGDKIPTEPELSRMYQISRITVRRTVEELCKQGYLEKQQGKGTFVKAPRIIRKFESEKNTGFSMSCLKQGLSPSSHVISFQNSYVGTKIQQFFACNTKESFFRLERILSADQTPIIYDIIYLPKTVFPTFDSVVLENGSLYRYLKEVCHLECSPKSRNTVTSVPAPANIAAHLQVAIGAPLIVMESYMEDQDGKPLFYSQEFIVGSRYIISF